MQAVNSHSQPICIFDAEGFCQVMRKSAKSKKPPIKKSKTKRDLREPVPTVPDYLRDFREKCVLEFDVSWICTQLTIEPAQPYWFRKILTLMLVGWALCPNDKKVRVSLAWHYINDTVHEAAKPDNTVAAKSYYINSVAELLRRVDKFQKLYRPLGGFRSKFKYSIAEIRTLTSKGARSARACLPLIDILVQRRAGSRISGRSDFEAISQFDAKGILDDLSKDEATKKAAKPTSELLEKPSVFSPESGYHGEPISSKNFDKHWKACQLSAEFAAALFCIIATRVKQPVNFDQSASKGINTYVNALDMAIAGKVDKLRFGSPDFQKELIQRAKFFAEHLRSRHKVDFETRYPATLPPIMSDLDIFSKAALRESE